MAKDPDDRCTMEIPSPEKPLQALINVLRRRDRTAYEIGVFVQKLESHGRATGDLEILMGVRDWRQRQVLLDKADGRQAHH